MTDYEALVRVVLDHPDQDVPRAMLRDCLEGDGRWAWPEVLGLVKAHPASDGPRLLAADWLAAHAGTAPCKQCETVRESQHGKRLGLDGCRDCSHCGGGGRLPDAAARRAEFIRVQCELARGVRCDYCGGQGVTGAGSFVATCPHCRPRFLELRTAESRLWRAHGAEWAAGLPGANGVRLYDPTWAVPDPVMRYYFRRGWVGGVLCPPAAWLEHGDTIAAIHPVTAVEFTAHPVAGRDYFYAAFATTGGNVRGRRFHDLGFSPGDYNRRWVQTLFAAEWPGVRFTLPTPDGGRDD
jgi:hypothetical protein